MSSVNILFWLLAALLGGLIWAIEAGLASRHKHVVLSSMAATMLSMLFMMFWVEDKTVLVPMEFEKIAKKKGGPGGQSTTEEEGGGPSGGGGGGSSGSGGGGGGENSGQSGNSDGKSANSSRAGSGEGGSGGSGTSGGKRLDDTGTEYSREPFKDCPKCPDLIIVPQGVVSVGAAPNDPDRQPGEQPAVAIPMSKPLAVGRLEILRQEFMWFVEETRFQSSTACDVGKRRGLFNWQKPGFEQDERHPVVCLSQPEVRLYLAWLSEKSGRVYRLPTEAEWEHGARAGSDTPFSIGPISRTTANVGRSRDGTAVGGLFATNHWGLSDVVGNVWEMTADCSDEAVAGAKARDGVDCRRLLKGGAWSSPIVASRHAARRLLKDAGATNDVGFRVVRDVDDRDSDKILTVAQKKALLQDEKGAAEIAAKAKKDADEARLKKIEEEEAALAKKAAAAKK